MSRTCPGRGCTTTIPSDAIACTPCLVAIPRYLHATLATAAKYKGDSDTAGARYEAVRGEVLRWLNSEKRARRRKPVRPVRSRAVQEEELFRA